jgi:DNA-binding CsgD family transcriptional regulator
MFRLQELAKLNRLGRHSNGKLGRQYTGFIVKKFAAAGKSLARREQALAKGREALRAQAWLAAVTHLSAADRVEPLAPDDLVGLSTASHLIGKSSESTELLGRAHQGFLREGKPLRAARCAFWLGYIAMFSGEAAQSSGWLARCRRLLEGQPESLEHGYLLLPDAVRQVMQGECDDALRLFKDAADIGKRFNDNDLVTLALNGQGRALLRRGDIEGGVTLLDEAMIAVSSGEVSPVVAGAVYCSLIESCRESFDLRRAQEWTAALDSWCASQSEMLPYRGACLLHRAEILQLRGKWSDAMQEAERAQARLSEPAPQAAIGEAFYRIAELRRLRGNFAEAETAYLQAAKWDRTPRPGIALLRLEQGKLDAANSAINLALAEGREISVRCRILDASVQIALARNDVAAAAASAAELREVAARHGAPFLAALSAGASGTVSLAEGRAEEAFIKLRNSWTVWCDLEAPYEAARVRIPLALACRAIGDEDAAAAELMAARETFETLGAIHDVQQIDRLLQNADRKQDSPLTRREMEVLRLVASGMTNRELADRLKISEKTVARHISNIFNKLDLNSRTAATAYAYQQGIV